MKSKKKYKTYAHRRKEEPDETKEKNTSYCLTKSEQKRIDRFLYEKENKFLKPSFKRQYGHTQ